MARKGVKKDPEVKGKQETTKGQLQYTLAGPSPFAEKKNKYVQYNKRGVKKWWGRLRG